MKLLFVVVGALALAAAATAATRGPNVLGGVMTGATGFAGSTCGHLAPPGSILSTPPAVDPNRDRLRVINRVGAP